MHYRDSLSSSVGPAARQEKEEFRWEYKSRFGFFFLFFFINDEKSVDHTV